MTEQHSPGFGPGASQEAFETSPSAFFTHDSQQHAAGDDDFGAAQVAPESAGHTLESQPGAPGLPARRRRSRRGGRGRSRRGRGRSGPEGEAAPNEELAPGAAPAEQAAADGTPQSGLPTPAPVDGQPERRRRGSRGGRRTRRGGQAGERLSAGPGPASEPSGSSPTESSETPAAEPRDVRQQEGGKKEGETRRRRGSRGGRNRRVGRAAAGERPTVAQRPERNERPEHTGRPARGGRRPAPRSAGPLEIEWIPGEGAADLPELQELPPEAELLQPGRTEEHSDAELDAEHVEPQVTRDQVILVNATDPEETRVAVVQGGKITDLQMTVQHQKSLVNDIYRGRVVNIEEAIGAAFIDFGQGRNGFLHASDVMTAYGDKEWSLEKLLSTRVAVNEWDDGTSQPDVAVEIGELQEGSHEDAPLPAPSLMQAQSRVHDDDLDEDRDEDDEDSDEDFDGEASARNGRGRKGKPKRGGEQRRHGRERLPMSSLLKKGQLVAVQITKDAIGEKGPTLTTYISIPGRYLVLMPCMSKTGVSRKIEDEKERKRLRRILESLEIPNGMGVIVRTAGVGKTKLDIERDLQYLLAIWKNFEQRLTRGSSPAPLYQESDVAIRTMRDLFSSRTEQVLVDNREVYEQMLEFTRRLMPEHENRIQLVEGQRPLFHGFGVEQDFERIFARRVELPSGGSVVFDQAEALVAIDVNSGRTREAGADFEDIALKTNLEAAPEIARQIRLRDLGGIIVVDFIDMMRTGSRRSLEKTFRNALAQDRARFKIGRISQFGLLELTRQRLGPGLSKLLYDDCAHCRGTGRVRTIESRAQALVRRLSSSLSQKGFSSIEVRARPEMIEMLKNTAQRQLDKLREDGQREIMLVPVPDQAEESVLRFLRTDGREVRPGGRRKR